MESDVSEKSKKPIALFCRYDLVGGLEHFLFHILGIIIPTDQYFSEG